jgi:hypothetical protein
MTDMQNPSLADVRQRRADIAKEIARLKDADAKLAQVEDTLMNVFGITPVLPLVAAPPQPKPVSPSPSPTPQPTATIPAWLDEPKNNSPDTLEDYVKKKMTGSETIKELIVLLMENCSDTWWTANEVQDYVSRLKGREIPMSTISPTLTTLKIDGKIGRNGFDIALVSKIKEATNKVASQSSSPEEGRPAWAD